MKTLHPLRDLLKKIIVRLRTFLATNFNYRDERLPYLITIGIALTVVVAGIFFFLKLTGNLHTNGLTKIDEQVTDFVISYRSPLLTDFFKTITHIGDVYGYIVAVGLCLALSYSYYKHWRYAVQILTVLILASVSNVILKHFIDRARPTIEHLVSVRSLSYPSGHAMSAMAFYGFVIFLVYRSRFNVFIKAGIILLLFALILAIGVSRIYLGVHFPSDIVGGFIAGMVWTGFCIVVFDVIDIFRKTHDHLP